MSFLLYLVKVSLATALFYLVFRAVFYRLTFFGLNRFYLLGSMAASLVLPMIDLSGGLDYGGSADISMGIDWHAFVPAETVAAGQGATPAGPATNPLVLIMFFYGCIAVLLFVRRFVQLMKLTRAYPGAKTFRDGKLTWKLHEDVRTPFTFMHTIYMHPEEFSRDTVVAGHERVHARQLHTVDLLFTEIMVAYLWFNPFVFLFRRHIRENHEFLADRSVLLRSDGVLSFLQVMSDELTRIHEPVFVSQFKSSTIKKRIIMITNKSSKHSLRWSYLVSIPLVALILLAFQQPGTEPVNKTVASGLQPARISAASIPYPGEMPSRFPLDEAYRKSISAEYGKEFMNPFTDKMMVHKGVDIKAPTGTPVYATADGIAVKVTFHDGYGNLVVLQHKGDMTTYYAHLDEVSLKQGARVKTDEVIGTVGNTGWSTGPHLHYEVRKAGENVDPALYW